MATLVEQQRLRMDLGFEPDDTISISNATIDAIFIEAGEYYEDPASMVVSTRVIALRRLVMQAANEVDYTKNNSSEKASQRYDHLLKELERWQGYLDDAIGIATGGGNVRSGKPMSLPPRIMEYPGGFVW